jgi:hypothetical protein
MTVRTTRTPTRIVHRGEPVERALMVMALGLDPRFEYTNHELQSAWRRRLADIHPDKTGISSAAVNAAYLALVGPTERENTRPRTAATLSDA